MHIAAIAFVMATFVRGLAVNLSSRFSDGLRGFDVIPIIRSVASPC